MPPDGEVPVVRAADRVLEDRGAVDPPVSRAEWEALLRRAADLESHSLGLKRALEGALTRIGHLEAAFTRAYGSGK